MAGTNYIPQNQGDRLAWILNFSGLLSAAPTSYGTTQADANALAAMVAIYVGAYNLAQSKATRTPQARPGWHG